MAQGITLNEDQVAAVREALTLADALVSKVISGAPGQQRAALDVARVLSDLRRGKVLISK